MANSKKAKLPSIAKLQKRIDLLEIKLWATLDGADTTLVATTIEVKGIEEELYSTKAQMARLTANATLAKQWHQFGKDSAELKIKACRAMAADEVRNTKEDEEFDEETRDIVNTTLKVVPDAKG